MGWTSYWVGRGCNRKDECMKYIKGFKNSVMLKSAMKGTTFYALMETTKGNEKVQWVLSLLTSIDKGEFYYKDIQCNPNEVGGIPMSILKAFKPSNDADKKWLEKCFAYEDEKKKVKKSFNFGDIVKCTNGNWTIEWNSGKAIKENETFYVRVETLNPFAKRKTKMYRLVEKIDLIEIGKDLGKTEEEVLAKTNGVRYHYRDTNYRLGAKSFDSLANKEIVKL